MTADQLRAAAPVPAQRPGDLVAAELFHLSNGNVVAAPPSGPVLRHTFERRRARPETFVPALARGTRALVAVLSVGWVVSTVAFWMWWLAPEHRVGWPGLLVNSLLLLYRVRRAWGWQATRDLRDMCRDAWRFQRLNPAGYVS